MNNYWKFAKIDHIEDYSFNKVLKNFYSNGIAGLVRENIQNSLDGKLVGNDEPVVVKINLGRVNTFEIPGIQEVYKRIYALKGENRYTKETIEHMKKKTYQNQCSYISFEDLNTKGLKGASDCEKGIQGSSFGAYAYNKGVHIEDEDSEKEKLRGGSHGIGKIASNAASDLFLMFFANCDENGNKHLGGNIQLIEHKYENQGYRATGYFTKDSNGVYHPYENEYNGIFEKNERGLKIIIPFLRDQFNNEVEVVKGICDSFFLAILEKKLVVYVNNMEINSQTLKDIVKNEKYYKEQRIEEIKKVFTPIYYDTYVNKDHIVIKVKDLKDEYEFNLYFNYDDRILKGRVGVVRTIGMKIEDLKVSGHATKPYNAVLTPVSLKEDEYLKSLENESHTELSWKHFNDETLQKNAKRFINNLGKEIAKVILDEMLKNNKPDGEMDTSDIIYNMDVTFKKDLEKAAPVVKVSKGKKGKTQNIVQIDMGKQKREKKNKETEKKEKKKNTDKKPGENQRKMRKIARNTSDGKSNVFLKVEPCYVSRGFAGEKEVIKLDLSKNKEMMNVKKCDLSLAVVDGMGIEHLDEFSIESSYKEVVDMNTGKSLNIKDNAIKDISLNDGVVKLKSTVNKNYNKTLKFVYHVKEV
ncbi:hypothetical protein [Oceanirhabdus sp. W0125-5]|uniref:hypothetical protein n=1 Tax=Oceanirhabdus sp. W0125-5 TaxID=2999116 RepID=UPI0022F30192|nr:hypothetical protein [Oceanirhabdus sp. W0125-5]WBW96243.1 hypothetical protein OW730_21500 [Oceanirhabdus sp. W0125-5]